MPRLIGMVVRWSLVPFLLLLAHAMALECFRAARGVLAPSLLAWAAGGLGFRILFHLLWRRLGKHDPLDFVDTLEHELTHALAGYATFCPPISLSATLREGGEVELRGRNPMAVLAPYFLPLWALLAALLGLAVKADLQSSWNRGVLFLLGCFAWRLAREYRWRQTDLHAYGIVFSTLATAILLMLSLGLLLWMRGLVGWGWLPEAGRHALRTVAWAVGWWQARGAAPGSD